MEPTKSVYPEVTNVCMKSLIKLLSKGFLGDLEEKIVKIARWPKCFFVKRAEARTVTLKQLIAVFSPVNKL